MPEDQPLLLLDIDGVISLFGFDPQHPPPGVRCLVEGVPHYLSRDAAPRVMRLAERFACVWCSGWEDRADMNLPHLLGLPGGWPHIVFGQEPAPPGRHWKLDAIDAYAGPARPIAWVDDGHDDSCTRWIEEREGAGLLVTTDPATGLLDEHVERLEAWADAQCAARERSRRMPSR
jgi:hypothetical protein